MLTCSEHVESSGIYTNVCCMPLMSGESYCRIHIKKNPYEKVMKQEKQNEKEFVDEHYLSTTLSMELFDEFEQSFNKIKKFLPIIIRKNIETKYKNDSQLTYKDINEIFDNIPEGKIIMNGGIYKLKIFLKKLQNSGWKEYVKYSKFYDMSVYHNNNLSIMSKSNEVEEDDD